MTVPEVDERDIWTLSPDGEAESLYDIPGRREGPEFSPDGKWLAYHSGDTGPASDIYVEPFPPTGAQRRISQEGGNHPLWSRDGSELFYRRTVRSVGGTLQGRLIGQGALKSVDIATEPDFTFGNEKTLPMEGFIVVGSYRDYDITPDGRQFLMVFPATQAESSARPQINIVLNWFEELKARVPTGK